jgi:hypothetical protein
MNEQSIENMDYLGSIGVAHNFNASEKRVIEFYENIVKTKRHDLQGNEELIVIKDTDYVNGFNERVIEFYAPMPGSFKP